MSLWPLLFLAHFWDVKAPVEWSVEEVRKLLVESPWATVSTASLSRPVPMHVASAQPMIEAELRERQSARVTGSLGPNFDDYGELLKSGKYIALAVFMPNDQPISDLQESRSLERDSALHIGKRTYREYTYFPPSASDPYLRYLFPRDVRPGDKTLAFDVYVPGVSSPQRHALFALKDMIDQGKPSY